MLLTFVRVHGLQVEKVSDDVILVCDAVAAQHVSGLPGHLQGLPTVVPLQDGDHLRTRPVGEQPLSLPADRRTIANLGLFGS